MGVLGCLWGTKSSFMEEADEGRLKEMHAERRWRGLDGDRSKYLKSLPSREREREREWA